MYWLDYSAAKLNGEVIKAAGYGGVIRYIDAPSLLRTKHTSIDEYNSHIAAGLDVRLVFQNTTTDADGGYSAGVANAQRALAGANMLNYTGVIFFTNDRPTLPNVVNWQRYLDGAASVLGVKRVGAYGFANAQNAAVNHASAFWQSGRQSELVAHANYWQDNNTQVTVGGITCDRNLVVRREDIIGSGTVAVALSSDEEDDMQPVTLPAAATSVSRTFIWDGRKAVLNVVSPSADGFVSAPLNWGPNGGTGPSVPTNPNMPRAGDGYRVTVNQPGQFTINEGTTRVFFSWSSADNLQVQIVPVS